MKSLILLALAGLVTPLVIAQGGANPVVSTAHGIFTHESGLIAAAVEQMPEGKFSFHPTADQRSFGEIAAHVAMSSNAICSMLSDTPQPQGATASATDSKEMLLAAVKASFAYCDMTLGNLQDSKLGDTITFFRGAKMPRARALFELTDDLSDHYSQMASYLRLSGMQPPSAMPHR